MVALDIHWQQLLWDCYHHGQDTKKDDAEIKELMGNYLFIERPQDISLPFNKKVDTTQDFINGIRKGLYDLSAYPLKGEALEDYVLSWDDMNQIYLDDASRERLGLTKKPFVYTYPERVLRYSGEDSHINQFDVMIERLYENIGSNRAVGVLYQPDIDRNRVDIPCLNWLQVTVRDLKVELHCMFRSNDLYGAWPSNMYLLTFYGLWITEIISSLYSKDFCFNGIHYHSSSLHIYKTDLDAVKKILGEK